MNKTNTLLTSICLFMALLCSNFTLHAQSPALCGTLPNTGSNHTVVLDITRFAPKLNGQPLPTGSYIVVQYAKTPSTLNCAGFTLWENRTTAISANGDDETTNADKEGYTAAEAFKFSVVLSNGTVISSDKIVTEFAPISGIISNGNTYAANGISALIKLEITTSVCTTRRDTIKTNICIAQLAGTRIDTFKTATNCDSIVVKIATFRNSDTTRLNSTTCVQSQTGVFKTRLINRFGCDSIVIKTVTFNPSDTTRLSGTTCVQSQTGVFTTRLTNRFGCDSIVIKTVTFNPSDTTRLSGTTCVQSQTGVFTTRLINRFGCDSIVIKTVTFNPSDTTRLNSTTCVQNQTGIFTTRLTNRFGCDSIVIKTVTFKLSDTTRLTATTCVQSQTGVFTTRLINRFGCDSIVIKTITFNPSDTTRLTAFTCTADLAGVFTTKLLNRYGCDSVVIKTVTYRPAIKPIITRSNDTLTSTLAFSYQWYRNDTLLIGATSRMYKTLLSGNYKVEIIDVNGCKIKSDAFVVTLTVVYNCPNLQKNIGDACDDGNPNTTNDKVQANCTCAGTALTNGLTITCPENIEVTVPQGVVYSKVNWNLPIASSTCTASGGNCTARTLSGFTFVGERDGHQYYVSNQLANWRDAKQLCLANGGYLAAITSQAETDYLKSKIREMVFIGLNDENTEGVFQWANGEPFSYTNWTRGQPSQGTQALTQDYVVFQNWDGKWDDVNGLVAKKILLEINCSSGTPQPVVRQISGISNGNVFSIGTTTVSYEAKDACNNVKTCSFTVTIKQKTTGGSNNYCPSKGNSPWEAWIGRVNFKQINQQSLKEGYGNFKNITANVTTNEVIPLSITPNFSYIQHNGFVRVWIDFNGDGDFFDVGEMVINQPYTGGLPNTAVVPITGNVTIPTTAKLGTTAMRVSFRQSVAPAPCDVWSNSNGEVEDYSVAITSNFQALVDLGNLHAELIGHKARLDWTRRSDKVAYFEVEKSTNGTDFIFLQKVFSHPNDVYHYIFDTQLVEGDNYYRLKIVQLDGKIDYTPIQKLVYEKVLDFTVFPNPAIMEAWIDLKAFEGRTLDIILSDIAGKVIHTEKVEKATAAPHRLDVSSMGSGAYFITIQTNGKRTVVRKVSIMK